VQFNMSMQGTLPKGCEVAMKQLYTKSHQSLDDYLNEIILVVAVKHKNLVKLKGCCIRTNQRLLVYEYVENGDLEQFLFGITCISQSRAKWLSFNVCTDLWMFCKDLWMFCIYSLMMSIFYY